jgi:hypothetical protein
VHKSKYSPEELGKKDQSHLERMLRAIKKIKGISLNRDYLGLDRIEGNTYKYYRAVKEVYEKYVGS